MTNLLVFDFHGAIIHAVFNFPGNWHDTKLSDWSGLTYAKLSDNMTLPRYTIFCNSVFQVDVKGTMQKIVSARRINHTAHFSESFEVQVNDLLLQNVYPCKRQSAKWTILALKTPFGRLRFPLTPYSNIRKRLFAVCIHILNLRTKRVV